MKCDTFPKVTNDSQTKLAFQKTICPECVSNPFAVYPSLESQSHPPGLTCPLCKRTYFLKNGIVDLVGDGDSGKRSLVQFAMELRPLVSIYEHFWRPLVTLPFSRLSWEMEMSVKLLELAPSHDLLDIACGTGNFTNLFSKIMPGGAVTAIDLSYPMLSQFNRENKRKNATNVTLMRVNVTKWPFAPNTFDRIHCAGALHLFPRIDEVFNSIEGSLRPGGIFVGATYIKTKSPLKHGFQKIISDRSGFHWFKPEELVQLALDAGFIDWAQHVNKEGIVFRVKKKG